MAQSKTEDDLIEEVIKRISDLLRSRTAIVFERDIYKEELAKVTEQLKRANAKLAALRKKSKPRPAKKR